MRLVEDKTISSDLVEESLVLTKSRHCLWENTTVAESWHLASDECLHKLVIVDVADILIELQHQARC